MTPPAEYADIKMVVVDDDDATLRNLDLALKHMGFRVASFNAPNPALDWIRKNGADIVITDVVMPGCDGFELLRQLKEFDPSCEVIMVTGDGDSDKAIRALRQGAADFFVKPFDLTDLRAAIERTSRFRVLSQQRLLLATQVRGLSRELDLRKGRGNVIVGRSQAMKDVAARIVEVANSIVTVLITGESGTGKELVANAIHHAGARKDKPMLTLNCASIPETLFESEMFGHIRGSFTGASETRVGYVTAAEGGSLFLDEIGDLPLSLQGKILRLLEQKTYLPVGASKERTGDIRLISATNANLEELVAQGKFRQDLYYRLSVFSIAIPPLRARLEDIPPLADHLAIRFFTEMGRKFDGIDDDAVAALQKYSYPGNVRELRNIVESAALHSPKSSRIRLGDLPAHVSSSDSAAPKQKNGWPFDTVRFEDVEKLLYEEALARAQGNVCAAARMLGISRGKLRRRMACLSLKSDVADA